MKCQYCGKELRERQRFCDRCGRTVRHINDTQRRTNTSSGTRRTQQSVNNSVQRRTAGNTDSTQRYDKYMKDRQRRAREQKMKKIKMRRFIIFLILLSLCIGIIGFIIAFNKTKESGIAKINIASENNTEDPLVSQIPSGMLPSGSLEPVSGADPSASPSVSGTENPNASASPNPSASPSAEETNDKYMSYKEITSGITCPYPSDFKKSDVSSASTKITVTDGNAQIRINTEKTTTQDSAQSILKSYSSGLGVEASDSNASKNIYSVSFVRNGKYNHRTGVIAEGRHIYYDFSCSSDSANNTEYKEIIDYMDNSLKTQIEKLNSEN